MESKNIICHFYHRTGNQYYITTPLSKYLWYVSIVRYLQSFWRENYNALYVISWYATNPV